MIRPLKFFPPSRNCKIWHVWRIDLPLLIKNSNPWRRYFTLSIASGTSLLRLTLSKKILRQLFNLIYFKRSRRFIMRCFYGIYWLIFFTFITGYCCLSFFKVKNRVLGILSRFSTSLEFLDLLRYCPLDSKYLLNFKTTFKI